MFKTKYKCNDAYLISDHKTSHSTASLNETFNQDSNFLEILTVCFLKMYKHDAMYINTLRRKHV